MAGKDVVLDTNIVVGHFRNAGKFDAELREHQLFLPHIVIAELLAGAFKSARPDHHRSLVETFLTTTTQLATTFETTKFYGRVWADLANSGKMIPQNDIWIAALCIQHQLPLVTQDAHFGNVDGLQVEH